MRLLVIIAVLLLPNILYAHSTPILCLVEEDIVEQCGANHTCDVREEVSTTIGVCQGTIEQTNFRTCDHLKDDADCDDGEVCRLGELGDHVGACLEAPSGGEPHHHDHDDHDHGNCSTGLGLPGLLLLLAPLLARRLR